MCDDISFAVIVAEGIHDSRAIAKFLELKEYREVKKYSQIPEPLQPVIPQKYPWRGGGDELSWLVTHPSFFQKDEKWVLVSNANGESNLGKELTENLLAFRAQFIKKSLAAVAIIADADTKTGSEKQMSVSNRIVQGFFGREDLSFDTSQPSQIGAYEKEVPLHQYIFPNNIDCGTLERLLIDGGRVVYPELLEKAEAYVDYAKTQEVCRETLKNFNGDKAAVGVVSNMLRPGKANQVSIHDDDWITAVSVSGTPSHMSFSAFLDEVLGRL